ncbi:MAG TPA: hypothetical protein VK858_09265 [Longimicrobiales bacterium]|nr:hypothetical protein [Longimicrobiales bacterium]
MHALGVAAIGGLAGLVILKILAALIFPLFGMMFGMVGMMLKIGMWIAIGYLVYTLLRGRRRSADEV